jgi:hypothetical protein
MNMTMMNKKNSVKDDFEFGVDSRYKSKKEREQDSVALMQAILERMKNVTGEQILHAKLFQLKFKMEDYLKKPVYDNQNHFAQFLVFYVDAIYSKRSDFAKDINITPNFLSKIINSHRDPNEVFILKLMIHSEKTFKHVGAFHKKTWYQVYFHEKLYDTMASQDKWRPELEKQVKLPALMSR